MTLEKLLNKINIFDSNVDFYMEIASIVSDHRKIKNGDIFVAIRGEQRDGNEYIKEAINIGAIAILTDKKQICEKNIPYIFVENARKALSIIWSNYYNNPSNDIITVAITGTNGKTSSAYFLYNILRCANISSGLISTVECVINDEKLELDSLSSVIDIPSSMTTPDPEILFYIYNKMKEKGVEMVVIEASSHALEQNRLEGIDILIGGFTNLSLDHLDYHGTFDAYKKAKEKLMAKSGVQIVNLDDEYGKALKEKYNCIGYSATQIADFYAENIVETEKGCFYDLLYGKKRIRVESSIIGSYTVYNSMLACACALCLGIDEKDVISGIKNTKFIKGRLEKYRDKNIFIDYAHTPDAMEKVITSVRQVYKDKKIIVIFGCGGNRDREKRGEMGRIASSLADLTIITSDNSRNEAANEIIADIVRGVCENKSFLVIPKRADAIKFATKLLNERYVLLLLGKGHEEYEIDKNGKSRFSEKEILDEVFTLD